MNPPRASTALLSDIVGESLDEATFLWRRWEGELASPTRNLDDIWSWTEDRLHGALDGVRIAGAAAVDLSTEGLLSNDVDRIAASAGVLAPSSDERAIEAMSAALAVAEGDRLRAIVRGLELLGSDPALRAAASVLEARGSAEAGALCRLKGFRRAAAGDEMLTAFRSGNPDAQVAAVRAAMYAPSPGAETMIGAALRSEDATVLAAAVESGMCRGIDGAWETAVRIARRPGADAGAFLRLLAIFGTAEDHEVIFAALRNPELQPHAIWALGHIGTARAAESCLAGMQYETLARACGEAYCWITGADLDRDRLASADPLPDVPTFEEDDLDANLVPRPEALWPLPDAQAVRRHWLARRSDFAPEVRHIHGRPATGETILGMIEQGPMLRRPDLALELRVKTRGAYDVEPRAFTARQRQMMAHGRAALSTHRGR